MLNNVGSRTDHCGAPQSNLVQELTVLFIITLYYLSSKSLNGTSIASIDKLYACNLAMSSL